MGLEGAQVSRNEPRALRYLIMAKAGVWWKCLVNGCDYTVETDKRSRSSAKYKHRMMHIAKGEMSADAKVEKEDRMGLLEDLGPPNTQDTIPSDSQETVPGDVGAYPIAIALQRGATAMGCASHSLDVHLLVRVPPTYLN
jgi:hypothetical protein